MLPILSAIPDSIKKQILDGLVNFIASQAEKLASEKVAGQIRKMSSQHEFAKAVEKAIDGGTKRFATEYAFQDNELVQAISNSQDFWNSKIVQLAISKLIKSPGAWSITERKELVMHFEDVLPGMPDRDRVDQAVNYFLRCVAEELWTLPGAKEVREVYLLQFQKITAETVREQIALARQQLEATEQLGADIRRALLQLTSAIEEKQLSIPRTKISLRSKPYNNLPRSDFSNLVGRESEFAKLLSYLSHQVYGWQIAIDGIGGIGKSALALEVAHYYLNNYNSLSVTKRFEAIIWISAKEEVLKVQGREKDAFSESVPHTLGDVYTVIANVLEREDITRALPTEQEHLVIGALEEQRTLLIMDNLESVKDKHIKLFLEKIPYPSVVMATSREWLDFYKVINLKELSPTEADKMIKSEVKSRDLNLPDDQSRRLVGPTGGIPLAIKLSVARIAAGENLEAVIRWLNVSGGELPKYCVEGQVDMANLQDPNSKKILLACSLFDRGAGASRDALGYVTNISIEELDEPIASLTRLFLINQMEQDRYWVLPIVQRYASSQFAVTDMGIGLIERWLGWLSSFTEKNSADLEWQAEKIEAYNLEFPNILIGIRYCVGKRDWNRVAELAENTWGYAYIVGLFQEFQEILDAAHQAAHFLGDERLLGRILLQQTRVDENQSKHSKKELIERAIEAGNIAENYGNLEDLGEAWATCISLYRALGNKAKDDKNKDDETIYFREAEKWAGCLWEKSENSHDIHLKYLGAIRFSEIKSDSGEQEESLRWANIAEQCAADLNATRTILNVYSRKGSIFLRQRKYVEAEELLLKSLEGRNRLGLKRHIALDKMRLARVYQGMERITLSRQYAEEARDIFNRLNMTEEYAKAGMFLENLPE